METLSIAGLTVRRHFRGGQPILVYLPGIHGDWTLVTSFRAAVAPPVEFIELAYPDRTDWDIPDYAHAVSAALQQLETSRFWLLAESFGSLVAWALLEHWRATAAQGESSQGASKPEVQGLILAGGFVRHPWPAGAWALAALGRRMPQGLHRVLLQAYAGVAGWRHRQAPETRDTIHEFIERRTPENRRAIHARLQLVARADYRSVARRTHRPVYALAGGFDPLVPWWWVCPWLRRHCPGFREWRLYGRADHNVLGTAPRRAAADVLRWIREGLGPRPDGPPA
ncbi:MAG: alpha/beta hydrolase [Limisphaera sp.]|nr:alpha/beta hydrolase [Limisphaera sp.]